MPNFLTIDSQTVYPDGIDPPEAPALIESARSVYRAIFAELEDDDWTQNPQGPLAYHWNTSQGQSATYLINLAWNIKRLHDNRTKKSDELIWQKLRSIFRPPNEAVFEEALVELEVGANLTQLSSPVAFEYAVPQNLQNSPNKPSSPDYALKYPQDVIMIEVTVWHWEAFTAWWRLQNTIHEHFSSRLQKAGAERTLRLELPVMSSASNLAREQLTSGAVADEIIQNGSGVAEFDVGCLNPARITWTPLTRVPCTQHPGCMLMQTQEGVLVGEGPNIGFMFNWLFNPCMTETDIDAALKSLRNSIDRKKRQRVQGHPYAIALSIYSGKTDWKLFAPIVKERLWPNAKYSWLSAILEYTPQRFLPPVPGHLNMALNVNPNATHPLPPSFVKGEQCHWPKSLGKSQIAPG